MVQRKREAKRHVAVVARADEEFKATGVACEFAEQERHRLLVVPHMGATAIAAPRVIERALPPPEVAVGRAKTGLRPKRREVEEGGFLHLHREVAPGHRLDEATGRNL